MGELAGLVGGLIAAGPGMSFDEIERMVSVQGRELLRKVIQYVTDVAADRERRLAGVADAAGVARTRAERGHARTVVSQFGAVTIRRIAYRAPGLANLHPRDAVLNFQARRYSWQLQQAVVGYVLAGAYEQGQQFLLAATGITVGKQQLEQIVAEAAADAAAFCRPAMSPAAARRGCRWRSRPTARGWRCAPRRAAAAPGRPRSGSRPSPSGGAPGRKTATSGWPRPGWSSTSRPPAAPRGPPSRSWAASPARPRPGRRPPGAGTP